MLKATRALIFDTATDLPFLIKSSHPTKIKWQIFLTYLRISIKLFTLHRLKKITNETILGLKVSFFDYGTFHFLYREIFIRNIYYFKAKNNRPLILDCGANIGIATLFFKWLYPRATIHAIEPDKTTFALLQKNIKQNKLKNVYLHNVALWNKKGMIDFYTDKGHPGWLTMSIIKERLPKDKITVQTLPLSTIIKNQQIDFLKMDVEGVEYTILQELNSSKKLTSIKEMVIEYHHGITKKEITLVRFLNILEKNGYHYQLSASILPLYQKETFQDINIFAY